MNDIKLHEIDALFDALSNLEHDNYERSYSGSKNREADAGLIRAALERYATLVAAQAQEAPPRDSLHDCALGDSNYAAGMLLGWNLCTDGRDEDFRRIREDRLRAAASASKEVHEAAPCYPATAGTQGAAQPMPAAGQHVSHAPGRA